MRCPYCRKKDSKVVDSRSAQEGRAIRRRRECVRCHKRFTTYEYIEDVPLMVVKKDKRRETFNPQKIMTGILKACEKRPISPDHIESIIEDIHEKLQKKQSKEISSKDIGELIMRDLAKLDQVAYVRFASVYRQFGDVSEFMKELNKLVKKR